MESAVLAAILWFVAIGVGNILQYLLWIGGFSLIAAATDKPGFAVFGLVMAWLSGVAWTIFAGFHCIVNVVEILQGIF